MIQRATVGWRRHDPESKVWANLKITIPANRKKEIDHIYIHDISFELSIYVYMNVRICLYIYSPP